MTIIFTFLIIIFLTRYIVNSIVSSTNKKVVPDKNETIFQPNQPSQDITLFKDPLWYHEDDYCMIELTPKENSRTLNDESEIINTKAKDNFDDYGFKDIHVISDDRIQLDVRKISPETLEQIISKTGLKRSSAVLTGYSTYREESKNTVGFGEGYSAIYFNYKDSFVNRIWLTNPSSLDLEKIILCLNEIGEKWNLVLMDWFQTRVVELSDKKEIENYLNRHQDEDND